MCDSVKITDYKFLLIGPPGIGKSTLVKALGGIDLEDYPSQERTRVLWDTCASIYGSADLDPKQLISEKLVWVYLILDNEAYRSRRQERDGGVPQKADQDAWHPIDFLLQTCPKSANVKVFDAWGDLADCVRRFKKFHNKN